MMTLVLCKHCTLVQLSESFDAASMFGDNYGYRSGLNSSMVSQLLGITEYSRSMVQLTQGDVVLDIGSNDGTLLRNYGSEYKKIGIDPSAEKFLEHYDKSSIVVSDFFSESSYFKQVETRAKIITSIAMLYDLEDPVNFAKDVQACLDPEGVWVFEQSYMPWMVITGAYDTICHEHIEYYSMTSILAMLDLAGLKAIDVSLNDSNGGSIRVAATHATSSRIPTELCESLIDFEKGLNLESPEFFVPFSKYVKEHPIAFKNLLASMRLDSQEIIGLGASTKGSILMQNANLTSKDMRFIAEVNPYKVGRWMANSDIPILLEEPSLIEKSDVIVIFPWHFKEFFTNQLCDFVSKGGRIVWPLPAINIESMNGKETFLHIGYDDIFRSRVGRLEEFGLRS